MTPSLEAVERVAIRLPDRVYSDAGVLSQSFEFVIGNFVGTVWTPAPYRVGNPKSRLSPPPGLLDWVEDPSHPSAVDWGYRNSSDTSTIATLCLDFEHPQSPDGQTLYPVGFPKAARNWVTTLHAWLSVLVAGPTDIVANPFLTWMKWDIEVDYLTDDRRSWLDPGAPLSHSHWEFAVERANFDERAPIPLVQIVSARHAHASGEYRSSVISSASAVELAIDHAIRNKLITDGVDVLVQNELLDRKTLGPLIKLGDKLGLDLPAETMTGVVVVRNRVVHASSEPTEAETRKALAVATQIVREHYVIHPDLAQALGRPGSRTGSTDKPPA